MVYCGRGIKICSPDERPLRLFQPKAAHSSDPSVDLLDDDDDQEIRIGLRASLQRQLSTESLQVNQFEVGANQGKEDVETRESSVYQRNVTADAPLADNLTKTTPQLPADAGSPSSPSLSAAADTQSRFSSRIILTTYPKQIGIKPLPMEWGDADPGKRGPVTVSRNTSTIGRRNAIGAHGGSYSIYYALAMASKEIPADHVPDSTNTDPAVNIGPFPQWGDPTDAETLRERLRAGQERLSAVLRGTNRRVGTDKFETGARMRDIARDRRPIWGTISTGDRPGKKDTIRNNTGYQVNRPRLNTKAICLSVLSFLALRVSADGGHHRAAKIAATAVSAVVSFGTGMTSLQLPIDSSVAGARVAKMCLRIFSSTFLLALIGCFMHWFCAGAEKTKRFISAALAVLFFGWVLTRVAGTPPTGGVDDAFSWLDEVNLFGLLAAVAGIINVRTEGMLRAEVDDALGSGGPANPLRRLIGNEGSGEGQPQSGGEGSGPGRAPSGGGDSTA